MKMLGQQRAQLKMTWYMNDIFYVAVQGYERGQCIPVGAAFGGSATADHSMHHQGVHLPTLFWPITFITSNSLGFGTPFKSSKNILLGDNSAGIFSANAFTR